MTQNTLIPTLETRLEAVSAWLYEHAPYAEADQKHLDAGSPEQAYWHLGYMAALHDAIGLMASDRATPGNRDTSNSYSPNEPGE
jgi:hypothetical protein